MHKLFFVLAPIALCSVTAIAANATWSGYAGDAQHSAVSSIASQPLQAVHWQTPVDLAPNFINGELFIHYGSPSITVDNTVIVPVKTGLDGGFQIEAFNGSNGAPKWTQPTDYILPPQSAGGYNWTPSYGPAIANGNTLYYPGAGGTVYSRGGLDSNGAAVPQQTAFYGSLASYEANQAAYNANVAINTPITADSAGNIYFGYAATGSSPGGLTSGIARISSTGVGSFFEASQLMANGSSAGMTQVANNSAPALSPDGKTVYVAMSAGEATAGRLVAFNSATLTPTSSALLTDQKAGGPGIVSNEGTASPTVGPDGDVYMGVLDVAGTSRGWLDHFSADLSTQKTTGGFGWDDTASIVPASMVPSYHGTSKYLLMTKYNNYADQGTGGNGQNMLAILDPNASQIDTRFNSNGAGGATIMKEVLTIVGPTSDAQFTSQFPGAVDEWCINTAVVDPATDSILVNSEDGNLYRWDLSSNSLTEQIQISAGLGEAYTPTLIGSDGTVYAINNATLFAVGAVPEPGAVGAMLIGAALLLFHRHGMRASRLARAAR